MRKRNPTMTYNADLLDANTRLDERVKELEAHIEIMMEFLIQNHAQEDIEVLLRNDAALSRKGG